MANKAGIQFSLGSLLIFVTLTAVVVKLTVVSPLIGIPAALLLLPSFVFSALVFERRRAICGPLSAKQKADIFADAMLASVVIAALSAVVFVAAYLLICRLESVVNTRVYGLDNSESGLIIGMLAASVTAFLGVWYSWRRTNK
jgi:hypothetical protein